MCLKATRFDLLQPGVSVVHLARQAYAVALTIVALIALAGAPDAAPLVQVSSTSPFGAACGSESGFPEGTNFVDSEAEPWIDVNPLEPDNKSWRGCKTLGQTVPAKVM